MEDKLYDNLLNKLYYLDDLSLIKKAYNFASVLHKNQYRDSGEAYVVHPLSVAITLANMHADSDTICAALLHDTLEDTKYTIDELQDDFGSNIKFLVNGLTNMPKNMFDTKEEQILYNSNHFIKNSLCDVRIILIKLSDRLHNMRTISVKSSKSIMSNSCETLYFYVPLARYLKISYLKNELEDLSFKYLYGNLYYEMFDKRKKYLISCDFNKYVSNFKEILLSENVNGFISVNIENIYSMYQDMMKDLDSKIFTVDVVLENKENISKFNFKGVNIYSPYEYLKNKYGVASDWFCNRSINDSFIDSDLYMKLQRVNNSYNKTFDLSSNKIKVLK